MIVPSKLAPILSAPSRASVAATVVALGCVSGCFRFERPTRIDAQATDSADGTGGDVASDIGSDVADGGTDAGIDTGIDAGVDSGGDSGTDSGVDSATTDVATDRPVCPPDASTVDAASPDGSAGGFAAGNCADNNGGCSAFATCEQVAPCLRRCVCARGLQIQSDGSSCQGLLLVSRTSTTRPGSSDGMRSGEPFVPNSGRYVAFASATIAAPATTHCYVADVVTGAIRDVSMVGTAHGENCRNPHVSNDGNRAVFISRGQVPMDSAPTDFANPAGADWVYYREGTAAPQRIDVHREVTARPYTQHPDGYTELDVSNDGRRAVLSTRWNVDPMSAFDNEVNLFSFSIPMMAGEPLKESMNSNRTNGTEGPAGGNIFGGAFSADGSFFVFHTQKQFEGYLNLAIDLFGRRLGERSSVPGTMVLLAPLEPLSEPRDVEQLTWGGTPNRDGTVVAFASTASARGVPAGRMRYYIARQRTGMFPEVFYTGLETSYSVPPGRDQPELSLSADARYLVLSASAVFTMPGETPADTNGAGDLYLFDVSTLAMPQRLGRVNVPTDRTDPPANLADALQRYSPRIAADGASVVFSTTQALVADDTNNAADVYLRVYR